MNDFNIIIKHMIQKSVFTERQIEIITKNRSDSHISRGAYYRQRTQASQKTEAVVYSVALLYGLGMVSTDAIRAIAQIGEQLGVIFDSDIDEYAAGEVMRVIEEAVNRVLGK